MTKENSSCKHKSRESYYKETNIKPDFKAKRISRDKEQHFIMINDTNGKCNITFVCT